MPQLQYPANATSPRQAGALWRWFALSLVVFMLAGCKVAVYSRMTEAEANETLYTLLQGGVDAEKREDTEGGFAVWAEKSDIARAIGLLKASAQPEQKHATLGELFGRNQLISTPLEERVRFIYGTEQALAQTLSKIDGVLVARVHIVLPVNDPLATEVKPASASVFIKHRSGQDLAATVPAIKDLVVRGIEGLTVDRVAVTLFAASGNSAPSAEDISAAKRMSSFLGVAVPADSTGALWLRFGLVAAVLSVVLALVLKGLGGGGASQPRAQTRRAQTPAQGKP